MQFGTETTKYQVLKPTINIPILIIEGLLRGGSWIALIGIWAANLIAADGLSFLTLKTLIILTGCFFFFMMISYVLFRKMMLKRTEFKFYEDKVEYYEGFLVKNKKTIHYKNISNISQQIKIIEGRFGLGTIFIDTAGSSSKGHELSINFVDDIDLIYNKISQLISLDKH